MFKYILKRILIFIPTLIVISFMIFGLSKIAPGDPVELKMQGGLGSADTGAQADRQAGEKQYFEIARELGMDLPTFYFGLSSRSQSDTIYKVGRRYEKEMLGNLSSRYGSWPNVSAYYKDLKNLEYNSYDVERNDYSFEKTRAIRETLNELYRETNVDVIKAKLDLIGDKINSSDKVTMPIDSALTPKDADGNYIAEVRDINYLEGLKDDITGLKGSFEKMKSEKSWISKYIPKLNWYGLNNQYHVWIFGNKPWFGSTDDPNRTKGGFLRGDFGVSLQDGRPVWSTLRDGLWITVSLNAIAIFLIYLISIPLGVYIAVYKDSTFDRLSTLGLFILYSLPGFWIATILIVFLTSPEYGMNLFPSFGLAKITEGMGFFERIGLQIHHLILPIFCMTYGGLAFLSRQMRGGVLNVFRQDYIRTAKAKGLSDNKIVWKHTFRNSLIPIITMFASLFPAMIGGSLILEFIFSIPGMGTLALNSLYARDWPLLYTIVMFSSILTLVGMLFSDIMYTIVDPRISFTKKA